MLEICIQVMGIITGWFNVGSKEEPEYLPSNEPSSQVFSQSTKGNITEESTVVIESPTVEHTEMGTCNARGFHDGL